MRRRCVVLFFLLPLIVSSQPKNARIKEIQASGTKSRGTFSPCAQIKADELGSLLKEKAQIARDATVRRPGSGAAASACECCRGSRSLFEEIKEKCSSLISSKEFKKY